MPYMLKSLEIEALFHFAPTKAARQASYSSFAIILV